MWPWGLVGQIKHTHSAFHAEILNDVAVTALVYL
jgi:hypothetical protein